MDNLDLYEVLVSQLTYTIYIEASIKSINVSWRLAVFGQVSIALTIEHNLKDLYHPSTNTRFIIETNLTAQNLHYVNKLYRYPQNAGKATWFLTTNISSPSLPQPYPAYSQ